ncbi:2'-5' RNA ligase family protein, partial [Kocuria oceani]
MHSLELLLGEDAEASVRADWDRLIEAGLPSSGRHRSPSNRPHITVVAAPSLAPETVPGIDERVAAAAGFVDLPLASAGVLL